jgi:hypothetical protein
MLPQCKDKEHIMFFFCLAWKSNPQHMMQSISPSSTKNLGDCNIRRFGGQGVGKIFYKRERREY